ncbi:MAG: GNAT family N-acetyltransferase [Atopostipes suicloacalis]|nr:GNAT family N-acetyltransferase [Atopostipes suicloacalis]
MKKFSDWLSEKRIKLGEFLYPKVIDEEMLSKEHYQLENGYEVKLKIADESDIENIMAIQKDSYDGKAPWGRLTVYNELKNVYSFFLIIHHYGEGLAFIALTVRRGHLHITNIGTKKAFQRQGLASILIKEAVNIASALEISLLTLEVRVSNQKAKNLYYR